MENASKALIIAGAILLSILIIGLGMLIFNQAKDAIGNTGMDKEKIAVYNAEFEAYLGTQSGSSCRTLCDLVRNHNNAYTDDESKNIIVQEADAATVTEAPSAAVEAAVVNTFKTTIKTGKTYTVSLGYDKNSGLVVAVGITLKK